MVIDVNTENHTYQGKQILEYKNNSPDTLNRVFYHLFFNAFRPNSEQVLASKYATFERRGVAEKIANLKSEDWGLVEIKGKHEIQKCSSRLYLRVGRNYNEEISVWSDVDVIFYDGPRSSYRWWKWW